MSFVTSLDSQFIEACPSMSRIGPPRLRPIVVAVCTGRSGHRQKEVKKESVTVKYGAQFGWRTEFQHSCAATAKGDSEGARRTSDNSEVRARRVVVGVHEIGGS